MSESHPTADKCQECGTERFRWMGGHHKCVLPHHPYADFVYSTEEARLPWQFQTD